MATIGRHWYRCVDTDVTSGPFRSSHRPISVSMLEHTRPLVNSTSADVGTDVAGCLARSPPLRFHIGRCRYRCVPAGSVPSDNVRRGREGHSIGHCRPRTTNNPQGGASAIVGQRQPTVHRGWVRSTGRAAQIGQCRPTSANVGRCRPMPTNVGQCRPI